MATIFEDDFNSYSDGDLNAQGGWDANAIYDVQGSVVKEGAKAVRFTGSSGWLNMNKAGTLQVEGRSVVYVRKTSAATRINPYSREGAAAVGFCWDVSNDGNIKYYMNGGWNTLQAYNVDQWYCLQAEWHSSPSHQIRYKVDDGEWTAWGTPLGNWTNGLDGWAHDYYSTDAGAIGYIDYIAENPYTPPPPPAGRSHAYIF